MTSQSLFTHNNPFLEQDAQDPLYGFDEYENRRQAELLANAEADAKKKKSRKRCRKQSVSYVISNAARRGHRVIKLQIFDYDEKNDVNCESVRVQYVVVDPIDEVMDLTENVIKKISKKLYDQNL